MTQTAGLSPATRFLVACAAFIIIVAGMRAAAPLITPFMLALFITILATPPLYFLRHRGLPGWLSLLLVSAVVVITALVLGTIVGNSLNVFRDNLPFYQERLAQQIGDLLAWLRNMGFDIPKQAFFDLLDPGRALSMAGDILSRLGNLLTNAFLILLTVIFMLIEASGFPAKLQAMFRSPEDSMERLRHISDNINRYMAIKTASSLVTGILVTLWLWWLGVDFPVLWGLIAFVLNFVPNIGSIIAAIPAVLLAVIQLGLGTALWVTLGYLVVNNVIGAIIEPRFMGRGLGLSTLVVFISLVFWGWILGPVGMFLSVPLTMSLKIALDSSNETRPLAILLGSDVPKTET